jgi:PAS domain S-box-containing protein
MLGDLLVAPLLLTWANPVEKKMGARQWFEALLLVASLSLVSTTVFFRPPALNGPFGTPYLLFPLFIWAALRFDLRGASSATVLASVFAIWGTVRGSGPFAKESLAESLFMLQTFMGCAALTPLVVGGAMSDRARAMRVQESFVATVSHDLQNPLGAILVSARSLARALPDVSAARVQRHDQLVRRNADRMLRLLRDLLDAAAIDAGRLSVELHEESGPAIAKEAVDLLSPLATERGQGLKVAFAEDLHVMCDRQRVLQVLTNLIGNAIKFSGEGRPILLRVERQSGAARVSVEDAGPGIEAWQLPYIFERYWHGKRTSGGGTGLGLFLAKGIVEAHGGRLGVESKVGSGTAFYFTLPLAPSSSNRAVVDDAEVPTDRPGPVPVQRSERSDETERPGPELPLPESEVPRTAVIEGALDCVISMDAKGRVTEFNPAAERTFGYRRPDVVGKPLAELLLRDLTERRRVEAALVKSEARFRRLLDAGIIGIVTANLHGNILEANAAFLEMTGYTAEEFATGKVRWDDITPPEWRYTDERAIAQLLNSGVAPPWEKEYLRKNGTRVSVVLGAAMLDDKLSECVAFVLDVSQRKEAEAAISRLRQEREEDLQASVRARDDFLAIASHELKTPLAALLMQIQGLQRSVRAERHRNVVERLAKAAKSGLRLERLVNQLLEVSRITVGSLRLEPRLLDLGDVVRDVVARLTGPNAPAAGCVLLRCEPRVHGRWDRVRMEQVVDNLVSNALKYGRGEPVEVDLHVEGDDAVLVVTDHGIGIDEESQGKIFEKFERAVPTHDFGGFGLGLWISRQVVEASGGKIDAQSVPGYGSTFTVRLPMRRDERSSEAYHVSS